jgi:hypothetical protein
MSAIDIGWSKQVLSGKDAVIIRNYVDGIKGGKVLDMTGFTEDILKCGHVIIKKNETYKPLPVSNDAYASLPEGWSYAGINMTTVEWKLEGSIVGIMTSGEVNDKAAPYNLSSIAAAIKTAIPTLRFDHD